MSFALLLESALRALLLGASVWVLVRLACLRDAKTETVLWTLVLLAALAMPLLMSFAQRWWPALPAYHLRWIEMFAAAPQPQPHLAVALTAQLARPVPWIGHMWNWLAQHGRPFLWGGYGLVTTSILARLTTGLFLTARLYLDATPVTAPVVASLAQGRAVRASARLRGPIAFGSCILLPADHASWPRTKLAAVLAHEQCHVQRGDFFIQLLAAFYRALFWFSPFAWWLQAHLSALAETASDEAAVRTLNDRVCYAEILIEVSTEAQGPPAYATAMSKGPDIALRIDRILDERPVQNLGWRARASLMAASLPVALAVAGAHAAVPSSLPRAMNAPAQLSRMPVAVRPSVRIAASPSSATAASAPVFEPARRIVLRKTIARDNVTYNPRALLETPTAIVIQAAILTSPSR